MYFNDTYYKYYPKIREEDIGRDTSNLFVDTFQMSNLHLKAMGGDYDGDQITCKGVYTVEANEELREFMRSKQNLVDFGCNSLKVNDADPIQSLYSLTRVLKDTRLTTTIEFR